MNLKQPLPESMRPVSLDDFVGQRHLKPKISALLTAPRLPSLLLVGPPGCGKSTLALILAHGRGGSVLRLSAPEAGLQQLRKQLVGVDVLVLDEIHRFSKAQQDFFLPSLENGEITMLATTTENPSFSVTRQLLSRLHVLKLMPLNRDEILAVGKRGAARNGLSLAEDVFEFLAVVAHGDGRTMLNLVEYIANLPSDRRDLANVKLSMPEILSRHDKDGDSHFELASALIKSIRGSEPDAALYYLACLLEGGEDPRFICRRLIISASEDIGLADPQALPLAVSCQQAIEFVGMPEGFIPLAETVVYLSLAPKSNTSYVAYQNAVREIRTNSPQAVPLHLRNASTKLQREWGYGAGYKYPHNFPNAWVEQDYFPTEVRAHNYYQAKDQGEEQRLLNIWKRRRQHSQLPERIKKKLRSDDD